MAPRSRAAARARRCSSPCCSSSPSAPGTSARCPTSCSCSSSPGRCCAARSPGAAVGLAAGWLLDLVPPGSTHLGVQALTYAAAGALAGRARVEGPVTAGRASPSWRSVPPSSSRAVGVLGALAVGAPVDLAAVARAVPAHRHRRRARRAPRRGGRARPGAAEVRVRQHVRGRYGGQRAGTCGRPPGALPRRGAARRAGLRGARRPARAGAARRARRLRRRRGCRSTPARSSCPPCAAASSTRGASLLADNRASTVVTIERRPWSPTASVPGRVVRDAASVLGLAGRAAARPHLAVRRGRCPRRPGLLGRLPAGAGAARRGRRPDAGRCRSSSSPTGSPASASSPGPVRVYPRPARHQRGPGPGLPRPGARRGGGRRDAASSPTTSSAAPASSSSTTPSCAAPRAAPSSSVDARGLVTGVVSRTEPVPGRDLVTSLDARVQAVGREGPRDPDGGGPQARLGRPTRAPSSSSTPARVRWRRSRAHRHTTRTSGPAASPRPTTPRSPTRQPRTPLAVAGHRRRAGAGEHAQARLGHRCGARGQPAARHLRLPGRATASATGSSTTTRPRAVVRSPSATAIRISCDTVFYGWRTTSGAPRAASPRRVDARDPFVEVDHGARARGPHRHRPPRGVGRAASPTARGSGRCGRRPGPSRCRRARTGYPEVADKEHAAYLKEVAAENCADGWFVRAGDAANFSIGQGDVAATPLQVAVMYAAIANGGTVVTPRVGVRPRSTRPPADGEKVGAGPRRRAPRPAQTWRAYLAGRATGCRGGRKRAAPVRRDAGLAGRREDRDRRGGREARHLVVRVLRARRTARGGSCRWSWRRADPARGQPPPSPGRCTRPSVASGETGSCRRIGWPHG